MIMDDRCLGHKSHVKNFCWMKKKLQWKRDYLYAISVGLFKMSGTLC